MRTSWCEAKFTYVTLVTIVHIRLKSNERWCCNPQSGGWNASLARAAVQDTQQLRVLWAHS